MQCKVSANERGYIISMQPSFSQWEKRLHIWCFLWSFMTWFSMIICNNFSDWLWPCLACTCNIFFDWLAWSRTVTQNDYKFTFNAAQNRHILHRTRKDNKNLPVLKNSLAEKGNIHDNFLSDFTHWGLNKMAAISKSIFSGWKKKFLILIEIPLKFVPEGPIDNKSASVQVMAWHHTSAKCHNLNQWWPSWLMYTCINRPQWVKTLLFHCHTFNKSNQSIIRN